MGNGSRFMAPRKKSNAPSKSDSNEIVFTVSDGTVTLSNDGIRLSTEASDVSFTWQEVLAVLVERRDRKNIPSML